ncbi:UNVERIFIED_CONTAM: hypothetical protein HDU68_002385 [Siphonaria sp. JEL0065]|nr:hypothetical protein HDU68_002385 [Siphonaria sp. JEL0065]
MVKSGTVWFQDTQCKTPLRIDYSPANATECSSILTNATCVPSSIHNGWFSSSACGSNYTTVGKQVFGSATQILALDSGTDCEGVVTGGLHYLLGVCVPTLGSTTAVDQYGKSYTYNSFLVSVDSKFGNLSWTAYSDDACSSLGFNSNLQTYLNYIPYGTVDSTTKSASFCANSTTSVQFLNYAAFEVEITYTGSDCSSPASIYTGYSLFPCVASTKCSQNISLGWADFTSITCTTADTLAAASATTFANSRYFFYDRFFDQSCTISADRQTFVVGKCSYSTYEFPGMNSLITEMADDGQTVSVSFFSGAGCQGDVLLHVVAPTDGSCTNGVRAFLPNDTSSFGLYSLNSSASSNNLAKQIGGIVGGVVGGLLVVAGLVFVVLRVRAKGKNAQQKSTVQERIIPSIDAVASTTMAGSTVDNKSYASSFLTVATEDRIKRSTFFDPMVLQAERERLVEAILSQAQRTQETVMFGSLLLPARPREWSNVQVLQWVAQCGGSRELLDFLADGRHDGSDLMDLNVESLSFITPAFKIRFQEELDSLKSLPSSRQS